MISRFLTAVTVLCFVTAQGALGQIPRTISYQGIANDPSGNPLSDGAHSFTFNIYDAETGGSPIFTETQTLEVVDGIFSASIGASTPIPTSMDFDETYYLGIEINDGPELTPRTAFTTSPYAFNAASAESLSPNATGVVRSLNGHFGDITLKRGIGISLTESSSGDTITIAATGGGGGGIGEIQNTDGALDISNPTGPIVNIDVADGGISPGMIDGSGASSGQVLTYNGSDVIFNDVSLTLPFEAIVDTGTAFSIINRGLGHVAHFRVTNTNNDDHALVGQHIADANWDGPAGVFGFQSGGAGIGVYGQSVGITEQGVPARGVYGKSDSGYGVYGYGEKLGGVHGQSRGPGDAIQGLATGPNGHAALFETSDDNNGDHTVDVSNDGSGNAIHAVRTSTTGTAASIEGITESTSNGSGMSVGATGVLGRVTSTAAGGWSAGVRGINNSESGNGIGVVGYQAGSGWGVAGQTESGTGVRAVSGGGGNAMIAILTAYNRSSTTADNIAIFQAPSPNGGAPINQARISNTGHGYFNGGTTNSGADVAELMDHEGMREWYEPGDVLAISTTSDVRLEKSSEPYSSLVVGVYATKPGVMLTEEHIDADHSAKVPCGVIGIIPTKVTDEGGSIGRGDILVTSSKPGYAMKADPERALQNPGCIIGKALQEFDGDGTGVIKVLVNVR